MVVLNKPKLQRTQISVIDREGSLPSANRTVYGATPKQVMERIIAALGETEGSVSTPEAGTKDSDASQPRTAGDAGETNRKTAKA